MNALRRFYANNKERIHYYFYWIKNEKIDGELLFTATPAKKIKPGSIQMLKSRLKNSKHISEGKNYISFKSSLDYNYRISLFNNPFPSIKINVSNIELNFRKEEILFYFFRELNNLINHIKSTFSEITDEEYVYTIKTKQQKELDWSKIKKETSKEYACDVIISKNACRIKSDQQIHLQKFLNKLFIKSKL